MEPQPIETAPKDGTVILTDCGFCKYRKITWWSGKGDGKWVECDPFGSIYECADNGPWVCEPKFWTPVPEWIGG